MSLRRMVWLLLVLIAAGLAYSLVANTGASGPVLTWQLGDSNTEHVAGTYQEVGVDEPLRLSVRSSEPLFVYVLSHDLQTGTIAWWPSPMLHTDLQNPLPAGTTTLPGKQNDVLRSFAAQPSLAVTDWIVIASRTAIADLGAVMPRLRQASNTTFTNGTVVVSNPNDGKPPIGLPKEAPPHPLLLIALAEPKLANPNAPMLPTKTAGIWTATLQIVAKKDAKGEKVQVDPMQKLQQFMPEKK
ncbi:MAG: hypothetical protein EXS02_05925 [Planctomycetes bacterium]|nr:hypothetical protein [Planctomycetota bacterium]